MNNASNIPIVDLNEFISGNPDQKRNFVNVIGDGFMNIGFVAVKNHKLEEVTANELYTLAQSFFSMPDDIKKNYEIKDLAGQRGYTSFGKEHAKGRKEGDLKEFWHIGQEVQDQDPIKQNYPENIVPAELPEFNNVGIKAYKQLEQTGKVILRAIAIYLGLDEFYFDAKIHNGNSILRPIHYGPILHEPDNAVRAAEHEDINLITLLMGASAEGLEILNQNGDWIPVTALPDQIIVNVGDMLQRLTNNKLRSSTHRVVNPPREQWHSSRYSMPFFMHPRPEMSLACLDECIDIKHPKAYEDINAGDYLMQRLAEIGLK